MEVHTHTHIAISRSNAIEWIASMYSSAYESDFAQAASASGVSYVLVRNILICTRKVLLHVHVCTVYVLFRTHSPQRACTHIEMCCGTGSVQRTQTTAHASTSFASIYVFAFSIVLTALRCAALRFALHRLESLSFCQAFPFSPSRYAQCPQ